MTEHNGDRTRTNVVLTRGTMVHHYRIVEKIGAGGMGEVYLAEDTKLTRQVALKFLPNHLMTNDTIRARFVREAQILARLNHPNIVSVHEVSEFEGRPFYVMELVAGESLHHYAHEKPLPLDMIIEYAIQISQGLAEAHRAGIIHRDIKSANIAVDKQGRIRLLDFGLAAGEGEEKITKTGSTLGTVSYMSPEQATGRDVDHRADLFSLGVVLYELIAGKTPFKRDSDAATLQAIVSDNPEPLSRYKSEVPEKLQQIVSELLQKDRELRFQSAEGVIAALKRLIYDSQQTSTTRTAPVKPKKTGLFVGGMAVAVLAIVAVSYFLIGPNREKTSPNGDAPMIAVLPFDNLGSPEDEYFAEGMTEEITSRLAGIAGLGVISRTSAMKYSQGDYTMQEVGRELGVDYVLEGTVRWSKVGDQPKVRITPQLIRVADDRHLWASNYERALMEVFAVQADIAAQIVEQLGVTLLESDKATLDKIPTDNAEAYQLYLKALNDFRVNKINKETRAALDSVIKLDSAFALAYALRSEAYAESAWHNPSSEKAGIALESARSSLELQPGLPQGHRALGYYYHYVETDYIRSMEQFSIAEKKLQNDPQLLGEIGFVHIRQGNVEEAISYVRRATQVDPLSARRHRVLCHYLMHARRYDEALQAANRAIALEPDEPVNYNQKIRLYEAWHGDVDSIAAIATEALQHCDTMEFAKDRWLNSRYAAVLNWDSLGAEYAKEVIKEDTNYYSNLHELYKELGKQELAVVYADSSRASSEEWLRENDNNPWSVSDFGLMLSYLGECERAIELGNRGKEMLTIDDCFY